MRQTISSDNDTPPYIRFDEDMNLLLWRPRGILNESVINRTIVYLGNREAMWGKPFDRFSDTLAIESVDLNLRYVFHVCLFRRLSSNGRQPVKSAILIPEKSRAQYFKLHAMLTQGSPLKVELFEEREAAAKWLGVTVESLATG